MSDENNNLEYLERLEKQNSSENGTNHIEPMKPITVNKKAEDEEQASFEMPKVVDGYKILDRDDMPFEGKLYPESWNFAYRCPTTTEVANFSTVNQQDQPAVINAIEELIKKCYIIINSENNQQVSAAQINDGERLYFFLKLREYYLHDKPISYMTMSTNFQEPVEIKLVAQSLSYPKLKQGLLDQFDGRKFNISMEGLEEPISFLLPTLDISARIFRYIVKTYRDSQKEDNDGKKDTEAFSKQFLLVAPFLYEKGTETIEALKAKFKKIQANPVQLEGYITIINKINLTNDEKITYIYRESEEEALIKFPGGWKDMFVDTKKFGDIF